HKLGRDLVAPLIRWGPDPVPRYLPPARTSRPRGPRRAARGRIRRSAPSERPSPPLPLPDRPPAWRGRCRGPEGRCGAWNGVSLPLYLPRTALTALGDPLADGAPLHARSLLLLFLLSGPASSLGAAASTVAPPPSLCGHGYGTGSLRH